MANIAKNKPGRPRTIPIELRAFWSDTSRRQQDNKARMMVFNKLIYPGKISAEPVDPIFIFLWDRKKDKIKTTILAELGRLAIREGDEMALQAARVICENKLSTARALSYLRRFKKTKSGNVETVFFKVLRLIDDGLLNEQEVVVLLESLNNYLNPEIHKGEQ